MPELPEVETVVRWLRPHLEGRRMVAAGFPWPKVTAPESPDTILTRIEGQVVEGVSRRGKFILIRLGRGLVHVHLRMTGQLKLAGEIPEDGHITAWFGLDDGRYLLFTDTRKFGRIGWLENAQALNLSLGPEPLDPAFTPETFANMVRGRKRQIKPLLLDQAFIAGLGNIYVDEALFQARIHPETRAHRLSKARLMQLFEAVRNILAESIAAQGTTIISFAYSDGQRGSFRERLQVFGKAGQPCPRCENPIRKIRVAQRGTHFCPNCQRRR